MIKEIASAIIVSNSTLTANVSIVKPVITASAALTSKFDLVLVRTSTVLFDPLALGLNLSEVTNYKIVLNEGFGIDSIDGELTSVSQEISITTPLGGPTISASSIINEYVLDLAFSRHVQGGSTGNNISLYTSTGTLVTTVASTGANVTYYREHCYVNFGQYVNDNSSYYVLLTAGSITDLDGFGISAVTSPSAIAFTIGNNIILGAAPNTFTFDEDTTTTVPYIQITDSGFTDSTGYTLTVTPSSTAAVYQLTTSAADSLTTKNFNSTSKVLTLAGTRLAINNHLKTMQLIPGGDYTSNFTFTYAVTTPRSSTKSKTQSVLIGNQNSDITNITIDRTYLSYQKNYLFTSSVPVINDIDPTGSAQYTITLAVTNGLVGLVDNPTSTYTATGSKTTINALFSQLLYYPDKTYTGNATGTYTQTKSTGEVVLTYNFNVNRSAYGSISTNEWRFLTSGTLNISYDEYRYGYFLIEMVGGGGGGGGGTVNGGGGGSGGHFFLGNISASSQSYSVVVGSGGTAGTGIGGNGGSSSVFGYTAGGGTGGGASGGSGGASGNSPGQSPSTQSGGAGPSGGGGSYYGGVGAAGPNGQGAAGDSGPDYLTSATTIGAGGNGSSGSAPTANSGNGGHGRTSGSGIAGAAGQVYIFVGN